MTDYLPPRLPPGAVPSVGRVDPSPGPRLLPILFDGPMVRAILADRKAQTRRVGAPRYRVGDILWVREAWRADIAVDALPPSMIPHPFRFGFYAADPSPLPSNAGRLRSSRFMPRWALRITLEVTGVREQHLQDISEEDAIAEGIMLYRHFRWELIPNYHALWDSINGKTHPWASNPMVTAYTFRRMK